MPCSPISRLIVLATICILPSCSNVQRRELTSREDISKTAVVVALKTAEDSTEQDRVVAATAKAVANPATKTAPPQVVPAVSIASADDPLLVPPPKTFDGTKSTRLDSGLNEGDSLSLAELEEMAMANNPTLQQAAWSVEKANGIRHQVGLYPNPQIGYSGNEIGSDGRAGQQGGYISQTIVLGDKLKLNRAVLDRDIQALSWANEAQRLRVLNDLRLAYLDALGAQRRVKLAAELVKVAQSGVTVAKDLFEARQGAKPDVLQAEIQLNEVQIIRQNSQNDYQTAWRKLVSVVGRPNMTQRPLNGELQETIPGYQLDEVYERLVAGSPELQAAHARVQRALANIRRQEAQPIPNLLAQLGAAHDYGSGDDIANVQIGVALPVFNANEGNISASRAEYQRAARDVERLRLALRVLLSEAFRDLVQARNRVERISNEILPRADENRKLTEEAYRQGEFDFLRVLTARRTYFETNIRYVEALTELRKADTLINGLLLTGGLNAPARLQSDAGLRGQALSGQ